jgi:hypothetical protein
LTISTAALEYQTLLNVYADTEAVSSGQMFGKPCLKVAGKAFVAQHRDVVVFKLEGVAHAAAMQAPGAVLWDPSGKGRPMKEWVALPVSEAPSFTSYASVALAYVASKP